jgi:hypothetical protein
MRRLPKVISGGQTGVDQAALAAARTAGFATGGLAPLGWLTEAGPAPWLEDYGMCQMPTNDYPSRTRENVKTSDATLWLGDPSSNGGRATCNSARRLGKPLYVVTAISDVEPAAVADWLESLGDLRLLNVAGDRESVAPGIGAAAGRFLTELFGQLRSRVGRERT